MKLLNAFSFNMIGSFPVTVEAVEISAYYAAYLFSVDPVESFVGHPDTAAVFTDVLGLNVPAVRGNASLVKDDVVIVGQYVGPRLPEGATKLPEGATIKWLHVTIK